MKWNTVSNKIRNNQQAQSVCSSLSTVMPRVSFVLFPYHDHYKKPYHCTQHTKQQHIRYSNIAPLLTSYSYNRMGCQETLRSKFPLKLRPAQFFHAPILLLTAHAPILLQNTNTPHAMTGNPAPIMALTPPPNILCERTYSMH
jgi:hypothetical protein